MKHVDIAIKPFLIEKREQEMEATDHGGRSLIVCRKDQRPVPPFGQKNDDLLCKDERERMYQAAPESALFLILFFPFMWFFA